MDILALFKKVVENEKTKGIPIMYVFIVITCVFEAIESGECFYSTEFD